MAKIFRKKALILLGILILAAVLRLWQVNKVPVSLFGDEVDVGYQAYSVLKTGKDYYGNPWPIHFHSLAEYRTPLYLYAAVPSVALFGVSPLGVRLPAVIFGILGVLAVYLLVNELVKNSQTSNHRSLGLIAALLLAISPWHLQYSRAGFEVSMLLTFLIFGLYFFFRSLSEKGKWLWISVIFLTFTPWIYSTAKLFTPLLFGFLFFVWRRQIIKFSRKILFSSIFCLLLVGLPIGYSTVFGGGAERAGYVSIFTDPTNQPEIGVSRLNDALVRGEVSLGSSPTIPDRIFHNKFFYLLGKITNNYFQTFSTDFLFVNGDPNPRHSIHSMGEFYKIDLIAMVFGFAFFFSGRLHWKIKALVIFWLAFGALPSEITRDGGNHATRLILILPPLILITAFGIYQILVRLRNLPKYLLLVSYGLTTILLFVFYLHNYYIHNPWSSERWWHAGYQEAIQSIKAVDNDYDKVIISMAGEPAWIYFAGWYEYPPDLWQKNFPLGHDVYIKGFGDISHIDKFYFGNFNYPGQSLYDLGKYIDHKTLYLAVAKEMPANLIMDPERTPPDLKLLKAIAYPSGEPAFYLFTKS